MQGCFGSADHVWSLSYQSSDSVIARSEISKLRRKCPSPNRLERAFQVSIVQEPIWALLTSHPGAWANVGPVLDLVAHVLSGTIKLDFRL